MACNWLYEGIQMYNMFHAMEMFIAASSLVLAGV